MNQKEYIQNVLIKEIEDILEKHKYLSFGLITAGIEFLGICIDHEQIFKSNESANRFRIAIDKLFPPKYKNFNNILRTKNFIYDLYSELRCGLNHSTLPKPKIGLSERKHGERHLSVKNGRLILVAEDFFDDFKDACNKVIEKINNGEINQKFVLDTP